MPYKKQEDGRYAVTYSKKHPVTKQAVSLKRIAKTKAEAIRKERQLIAEIERKIAAQIIPTWGATKEGYYQDCRKRELHESTIYNAQKCLDAATREWDSRLINSISTEEIRDLIMIGYSHRSVSHQKSLLKFIRQAFQYAVDRNDLHRNPGPKISFKIGDKIKKVLTEPQIRIVLEAAKRMDWSWYYHVAAAIYTGMRNGELYALTWDRVNLVERQILVNCSWSKKDGFKETKSGDDRIVEIAPPLLVLLKELKLSTPDTHYVLPRLRKWDMGDQARQLRQFLLGIGLPEIRFHDLRASWATIMLSKGIPPAKVMMMGGWKNIKTMMIYMRKAGVDIKGITDGLNLHDPSRSSAKVLDFSGKSL